MSTVSRDFTIDPRRLRVLRELEQHGTVSATARVLHLTPSAVSQQLAVLARELGVPLLRRQGRLVQLTGQAHILLEHASVVEEQLERARADLAAWDEGMRGELAIGSLSTGIVALVAPMIATLRQQRPGLAVRVVESEPPDVFAALDRGELDVVVTADYPQGPARYDRRYHRVDLLTDPLDAALPVGHPVADPAGIRLADLADEQWVSAGPADPCAQSMMTACAAAGFTPQVRHRSTEWAAVAALVAAGAGVSLIPRLAQPLPVDGLVCAPVIGTTARRVIFAAIRAGAEDEPGIAATLDALSAAATRFLPPPADGARLG